jgi:hypothetical protein
MNTLLNDKPFSLVAMQVLAYASLSITIGIPIFAILLLLKVASLKGFLIMISATGLIIGGSIGWVDKGYIEKVEEAWNFFKKVNPVRIYFILLPQLIIESLFSKSKQKGIHEVNP